MIVLARMVDHQRRIVAQGNYYPSGPLYGGIRADDKCLKINSLREILMPSNYVQAVTETFRAFFELFHSEASEPIPVPEVSEASDEEVSTFFGDLVETPTHR